MSGVVCAPKPEIGKYPIGDGAEHQRRWSVLCFVFFFSF